MVASLRWHDVLSPAALVARLTGIAGHQDGGALGLAGKACEVDPLAFGMGLAADDAAARERVDVGSDEAAVGGAAPGGVVFGHFGEAEVAVHLVQFGEDGRWEERRVG